MRRTFHEHYVLTKKELDALWKDGLIVPDTNVLLNLYRYPDKASQELFRLLADFKHQLFLPHRVGFEFHRRRETVIQGQRKEYGALLDAFRKALEKIDNPRRHPFVSQRVSAALRRLLKPLEKEVDTASAALLELIDGDDSIRDMVGDLFEGRVGPEYPAEEIEALRKEADLRFKSKIPPGFRDENKKDDDDEGGSSDGRYGDVFIWKQILSAAKAQSKGVLLITDDAKDDWWIRRHGRARPHPMLRKEFYDFVGKPLHMYRTDTFMEHAGTYSKRRVDKEAIKEVKEILADLKAEATQTGSFSLPLLTGLRDTHMPHLAHEQAISDALKAVDFVKTFQAEAAAARASIAPALTHERALFDAFRAVDFVKTFQAEAAAARASIAEMGRLGLADAVKGADFVKAWEAEASLARARLAEIGRQDFAEASKASALFKQIEADRARTAAIIAALQGTIGTKGLQRDFTAPLETGGNEESDAGKGDEAFPSPQNDSVTS